MSVLPTTPRITTAVCNLTLQGRDQIPLGRLLDLVFALPKLEQLSLQDFALENQQDTNYGRTLKLSALMILDVTMSTSCMHRLLLSFRSLNYLELIFIQAELSLDELDKSGSMLLSQRLPVDNLHVEIAERKDDHKLMYAMNIVRKALEMKQLSRLYIGFPAIHLEALTALNDLLSECIHVDELELAVFWAPVFIDIAPNTELGA